MTDNDRIITGVILRGIIRDIHVVLDTSSLNLSTQDKYNIETALSYIERAEQNMG